MSIGAYGRHYVAPAPDEPPSRAQSPGEWIRRNLFNNWYNSLLTIVLAPALGYIIYRSLWFVFVSGRWEIVEVNLANFMVGLYPREQLWRLAVAIGILAVVVGLGLGVTNRTATDAAAARGEQLVTSWQLRLRRAAPLLALLAVIFSFVRTATPLVLLGVAVTLAVAGFVAGRRIPRTARRWVNVAVVVGLLAAYFVTTQFGGVNIANWGGFLLTAFLAIGAIALSFPLGVLLALGRRSSLPAIRIVAVGYIELMRGLPLIALLFMGWLIIPFVLPVGFPTPDVVWRALIVFIMFTAAYVAEIVRGGLQSIPAGQYEAANALGLSTWTSMRMIILPQALRNVIPALVGQFISLFKDTSLVLAVGLTDLLRVGRQVTQQPDFLGQGLIAETLIFVSFIYWVCSYWMSRESQRLEQRLGLGER